MGGGRRPEAEGWLGVALGPSPPTAPPASGITLRCLRSGCSSPLSFCVLQNPAPANLASPSEAGTPQTHPTQGTDSRCTGQMVLRVLSLSVPLGLHQGVTCPGPLEVLLLLRPHVHPHHQELPEVHTQPIPPGSGFPRTRTPCFCFIISEHLQLVPYLTQNCK